jgi:hypothetical protein
MSAPDEIRQLADRLTAWCDWMEHDYPNPKQSLPDRCDDQRAAAVALRHHANLTDAVGAHGNGLLAEIERHIYNDRHGINEYGRLEGRAANVARLLAAAVSPPPAPTTCPTCGGTWKLVHGQHPHHGCSNVSWHQRG